MFLIEQCHKLIYAYKEWLLGNMKMPEDSYPEFQTQEERLCYFTLPMALNYQRNSYTLWESANNTFQDPETKRVFDMQKVSNTDKNTLAQALLKHKVALQPNKHTQTRSTISQTIYQYRWSLEKLLEQCNYDFLLLRQTIQKDHKKWFPYLSWPKIFHYRSYILWEYCSVKLTNREYIEIAPDTHVIQCSIRLWIMYEEESLTLTRDQISQRRRDALSWSGILPIDMHSPLWFRSRNNFQFELIP